MNRRQFLTRGVAGAAVIAGSGLFLHGCSRDLRADLMGHEPAGTGRAFKMLGSDGYKILYYASLAPSGHNSQPWFIKVLDSHEWIICSDRNRWLPEVDGDNREVLLSIGAFLENLVQAAGAFGFEVEATTLSKDRFDENVVRVKLEQSGTQNDSLKRIAARRTVKSGLRNTELRAEDVDDFSRLTQDHLYYFPRGTTHSDVMAKEAVDNFAVQFENQTVMREMAAWSRFKDEDVKKYRDGLTPDSMEIKGVAGLYVRYFMNTEDVLGDTWKQKGIEKIKQQAAQGGGWIVITSDGNTVHDLVETGQRFQRMSLMARQKSIAIHPMTQTLEESRGKKNIQENHPPSVKPQFMLRVGYLDKYPDPVSLRRPVEWFVR